MFIFHGLLSVKMVGVELSAELHMSLWKDSHNDVKEEGKVYKAHLWQRLGQDEDKEREDEEDEVM